MSTTEYETEGGIRIHRTVETIPVAGAIVPLVHALDSHRGALLASTYEYPGRYTRWDMGFVDPPLALVARGRTFRVEALNSRGRVMLAPIAGALGALTAVEQVVVGEDVVAGTVRAPAGRFAEEDRSRQPSVFSVLRALVTLFRHPGEPHLGLYGAFGYDLAFQFEPVRLRLQRCSEQRDLVLYLPDELIIVDHRREVAMRRSYDFEAAGRSTAGLRRTGESTPYAATSRTPRHADHEPGEHAAMVRLARESFKRGDLFEVVPGRPSSKAVRRRHLSSSTACARATPRPTASSSTWATRSTSSAPHPKCTCAWRATAWRPARSRGRSPAAAIRSAMPPRSSPC